MAEDIKKKVIFLESKGFKFISGREVWLSKAGELSREFVDDNFLDEIKQKLSKAEKASGINNEPFKLYN